MIRERLAVSETAPLYCSLSDVTADPQYYHKAWEFSNHRSARAMRGLAFHYLRATEVREYEKYMKYDLVLDLNKGFRFTLYADYIIVMDSAKMSMGNYSPFAPAKGF